MASFFNAINVAAPGQSHPRSRPTFPAERLYTTAFSLMVATLAASIAILATRQVERVLLAIAVLNISWQVQKHFFLRQAAQDLGSLGGLEISLTTIALVGLYAAWLARTVGWRGCPTSQRRSVDRVILPAFVFLLFCVASLAVAGDTVIGVFGFLSVLERFLLFLYIARTVTTRQDVVFIIRILLIGLIVQSCLMLAQAGGLIGDIQFYGIKTSAEFGGDVRISGTIGAPNMAAAYLAMMMAVAVGVALADGSRADRYLGRIGLAMATVPLILTSSRGGWLSFATALGTILVFGRRRIPWRIVGVVFVFLALLVVPFTGAIGQRLNSDDNGSAAARMPLNKLAFDMIVDHPLAGVGINNFALAMEPYLTRDFSGDFLYTVHNTYLLVWAETGIGGLIVFAWLLFAALRQGSRCWRSRDPLFAFPALGCAAAIVGFMVQMLFDPFRTDAANYMLWLLAGLITAMTRLSTRTATIPQPGMTWMKGRAPLKLAHPATMRGQA